MSFGFSFKFPQGIIEPTPQILKANDMGIIFSNFHHSYNLFLICLSQLTDYVLRWLILATQFSYHSMSSLVILLLA